MKKNLTNRSNIKRRRTHGFLKRMSTPSGQKTIQRRRKKGRWNLIP